MEKPLIEIKLFKETVKKLNAIVQLLIFLAFDFFTFNDKKSISHFHMSENKSNNFSIETFFSILDSKQLQNEELLQQLANTINQMILNHFDQLIQLLYRIDVNEMKLKTILKENPNEDAGMIIAKLIIQRQIQKINLRKEINSKLEDALGDEEW